MENKDMEHELSLFNNKININIILRSQYNVTKMSYELDISSYWMEVCLAVATKC